MAFSGRNPQSRLYCHQIAQSPGSLAPGRYSSYVLDGSGQPLLRLRAGAVHTANLLRSPHCSLFVQARPGPALPSAAAALGTVGATP